MNLLSPLGPLPASDSKKGELGKVDRLKLVRMFLILGASYAGVAILQALIGDISSGTWNIPEPFVTPITGALSLALEALRRIAITPPKD